MSYENMLLVVLIFACAAQFYLTFIKGRSSVEDFGKEIYRLRVNALKVGFLGLLFVFIIFYLFYSLIKSNASALGLFIVAYFLFAILDFSKIKIITDKGIGQKSLYIKKLYNFTLWEDMTAFEWHEKRKTMLIFKFNKDGKLQVKDWEVSVLDREVVEKIFKENVKIKTENNVMKSDENQEN